VPEDILELAPPPADKRLTYGPDLNQFADLRRPAGKGPHPVVLNLHGGFWRARYDLLHAGHLCAALTRRGIATVNLEYRRVGNPGGGWPGTFDDARAGLEFLARIAAEQALDLGRVVVSGHSAGGHLALWLAARPSPLARPLRGVVALAPLSNLWRTWELHLSNDAVVGLLGGTPQEVAEHYAEASPSELSIAVPQRLVHGAEDDVVPLAMSRDYVAKKKAREDVGLIEPPHCDHFDLIDPRSAAWPRVEGAVLELLR
jgi:acetyl esterase/lipase